MFTFFIYILFTFCLHYVYIHFVYNYRQDFVDVTLACADGSTLEAHKVVLSSVSSYFRDILKVSLGL